MAERVPDGAVNGSPHRVHWNLDPDVTFLNHGSFGACPRAVLERQQALRTRLEAQPVEFLMRHAPDALDAARAALADFLGCEAANLVPVTNATSGVNAVLRSLVFAPGDELLVTDHGYNACRNALEFVAERHGARVVCVALPNPVADPRDVVDALVAATTDRTRLALVDHVTSPSGWVLPIAAIVEALEARGVDVLVDGAHAPGMLELALDDIGAAYYTGNCHKWLCAPKGAAFLHVRPDRQDRVRPLTISHGVNRRRPGRSRLHDEFDWAGTDDPTPFLCVPEAIETVAAMLPGGWPEVRATNRALALAARRRLAGTLGVAPSCPESMIGTLAAVAFPSPALDAPVSPLAPHPLQGWLLAERGIEIPVMPVPGRAEQAFVRFSAQLYNHAGELDALCAALAEAAARGLVGRA